MQRGWVTGWDTWDASPGGFDPGFTIPVGIAPDLATTFRNLTPGTVVLSDGCNFVFVRGEGFVKVCDSPFFEDESPMDWERVAEHNAPDIPIPTVPQVAVVPVIDPDFRPTATVGESEPRDSVETEPVSFWDTVGDIFTTTAPVLIDQYGTGQGWWGTPATPSPAAYAPSGPGFFTGPASVQGRAGAPAPQPTIARKPSMATVASCDVPANARYLRYNCQTGEYSKIPRRRRRRLLTSGDLKDLAALKSIVGGGDKMNGAVVAAIRR